MGKRWHKWGTKINQTLTGSLSVLVCVQVLAAFSIAVLPWVPEEVTVVSSLSLERWLSSNCKRLSCSGELHRDWNKGGDDWSRPPSDWGVELREGSSLVSGSVGLGCLSSGVKGNAWDGKGFCGVNGVCTGNVVWGWNGAWEGGNKAWGKIIIIRFCLYTDFPDHPKF